MIEKEKIRLQNKKVSPCFSLRSRYWYSIQEYNKKAIISGKITIILAVSRLASENTPHIMMPPQVFLRNEF